MGDVIADMELNEELNLEDEDKEYSIVKRGLSECHSSESIDEMADSDSATQAAPHSTESTPTYEKIRKKNIEEKKQKLIELNLVSKPASAISKVFNTMKTKVKKLTRTLDSDDSDDFEFSPRKRTKKLPSRKAKSARKDKESTAIVCETSKYIDKESTDREVVDREPSLSSLSDDDYNPVEDLNDSEDLEFLSPKRGIKLLGIKEKHKRTDTESNASVGETSEIEGVEREPSLSEDVDLDPVEEPKGSLTKKIKKPPIIIDRLHPNVATVANIELDMPNAQLKLPSVVSNNPNCESNDLTAMRDPKEPCCYVYRNIDPEIDMTEARKIIVKHEMNKKFLNNGCQKEKTPDGFVIHTFAGVKQMARANDYFRSSTFKKMIFVNEEQRVIVVQYLGDFNATLSIEEFRNLPKPKEMVNCPQEEQAKNIAADKRIKYSRKTKADESPTLLRPKTRSPLPSVQNAATTIPRNAEETKVTTALPTNAEEAKQNENSLTTTTNPIIFDISTPALIGELIETTVEQPNNYDGELEISADAELNTREIFLAECDQEHEEELHQNLLKLGFKLAPDMHLVRCDPSTGEAKMNQSLNYLNKYQEVADILCQITVYKLKNTFGLEVVELKDGTPILASPNLINSERPILVLMQGMPPATMGIWSREVCVKKGLQEGSVIPYVEDAKKRGMNVLIMNTNKSSIYPAEKNIHDKKGMQQMNLYHAMDVFDQVLKKSVSSNIVFVAHSRGGDVLKELTRLRVKQMEGRVSAIKFTDSAHDYEVKNKSREKLR